MIKNLKKDELKVEIRSVYDGYYWDVINAGDFGYKDLSVYGFDTVDEAINNFINKSIKKGWQRYTILGKKKRRIPCKKRLITKS